MIGYFKLNDPYRVFIFIPLAFFIALVIIVVKPAGIHLFHQQAFIIGSWNFSASFHAVFHPSPLSIVWTKAISAMLGSFFYGYVLLGALLIAVEAIFFSFILSYNRVFVENNFIGGFIYILSTLFFPEFYFPLPVHLWLIIGLASIHIVLRSIAQPIDNSFFVGLGLLQGVSLLIYPFYGILICFLLSMVILTSFKPHQWVIFLFTGLLLPAIYLSYSFQYVSFFDGASLVNFFAMDTFSAMPLYVWFIVGATLLFGLLSANPPKAVNYQIRQRQLFFLLWLSSVVTVVMASSTPAVSVILLLPYSFFFTYYLLALRRLWIYRLVMVLFLGLGIFTFQQQLQAWQQPPPTALSSAWFIGKPLSTYSQAIPATSWLFWSQQEQYLQGLSALQKKIVVYEDVILHQPALIHDADSLFYHSWAISPELQQTYTHHQGQVWKRNPSAP